MFCFIFLPVGSIVAGTTSFSFLEDLATTSPGGWRVVAGGRLEIWRIRLTQPAGARLSLAILDKDLPLVIINTQQITRNQG